MLLDYAFGSVQPERLFVLRLLQTTLRDIRVLLQFIWGRVNESAAKSSLTFSSDATLCRFMIAEMQYVILGVPFHLVHHR